MMVRDVSGEQLLVQASYYKLRRLLLAVHCRQHSRHILCLYVEILRLMTDWLWWWMDPYVAAAADDDDDDDGDEENWF